MSTESIPVDLQSLLVKLHFIAQIERGQKPCMSDMSLVSASSYLVGPLVRRWKGESRKTLISDIEKIIEEAIVKLKTCKEKYVSTIIDLLVSDRVSIESLSTTYRGDPQMISSINVILTNIDMQLEKYPEDNNNNNTDKTSTSGDNELKLTERSERRRRRHRQRSVAESYESHE